MTTEGYYVLPPISCGGRVLPLPPDFAHDLLRRVLFRWSIRFTADERMQIHLVEKTIDEMLEELPELTDDAPIDADFLRMMRRVALREFRVHNQLPEEFYHERRFDSLSENQ